jgi:hypothetical protein
MTQDELMRAYELSEKRQELAGRLKIVEAASFIEFQVGSRHGGSNVFTIAKSSIESDQGALTWKAIVEFATSANRAELDAMDAELRALGVEP